MAKNFVQANFKKGSAHINVGLALILWEEDGIHYQYAPELDITGYGKSAQEAKNSFEHVLDDFITYTVNKKTLFDELERLGWTTNKKKKRVCAPDESQLLDDNETYRNLVKMPGIQRSSKPLEFAL